ncbi:PspC domain-containing protein [Marinitenerispora sediminis]|uniref:PspC domain-containing protein n=1 Tax=Marinitenerispora sediminis TaxID=1931232 RepID=UPI000DF238DE|nr:PspC domain-containing protein [Marinitenerispora sediminis]RCV48660.1 hypothetical protein DEF28_22900 [Marinitenerispora sediminis]
MQQDDSRGGGARQGAAPASAAGAPTGGAERELRRDDAAGVLTGVCAGLGAYTRTDPVVWRVGFVMTALAGGTGLWLYLAAWVMMRDSRGGPAMIEQLLNRRLVAEAVLAVLGVGLAAATALSLVGGFSWGTLVLATPLILGLLTTHNRGVDLRATMRDLPGWLRSREPAPSAPAPPPAPSYYNPAQPWAAAPSGPIDLAVVGGEQKASGEGETEEDERGDGGTGGGCGRGTPGAGDRTHVRGARKGDARRRRGGVPLLSVVLWTVFAGVLAVFAIEGGTAWSSLVDPRTGPVYLGGALLLVGLALVAAAWVGRGGGLIATGTLLALALVAVASLDVAALRVGDPVWRPTSAAQAERPFHLSAGSAVLDLTGLPLEQGQRVSVRADVGLGVMEVLAPETARVTVRGRTCVGAIQVGEVRRSGVRLTVDETLEPVPSGPDRADDSARSEPRPEPAGEPPTLVLTLVSHGGDMEVRHVPA